MKTHRRPQAALAALALIPALATAAGAQKDRQRVEFSAEVDNEAIISISRNRISIQTDTIEPVYGLRYKFGREFPRQKVECYFKSKKGRGRIELLQQPDAQNRFTAVVRITDPPRARARYEFVLAWE